MTAVLRQMTIEDAKTLLSRVSDDSALRQDLGEDPDRVASALGFSLSNQSAAFLAGVAAAGEETGRGYVRPAAWA